MTENGKEILDQNKDDSIKIQNLIAWGYTKGIKVHLGKGEFMELYENNFFGQPDQDELILEPEETALLIERGKIRIYKNLDLKNEINLNTYVTNVSKENPDFWGRYLVYKDLRSRGYVVRAGYGGGKYTPYRRYPRGAKPNKAQSDTFIYPFTEGSSIDPHQFDLIVIQAQSNRKSLILGIVDRSGDVTYYKVSEFQIPINLDEIEWLGETS